MDFSVDKKKIIEEKIKRWKNKLIDLSKRNRLLNFKPTKASTVRIIDELPPEVFHQLINEEKAMKLLPHSSSSSENDNAEADKVEEHVPFQAQEFQSYDKESLEEKHSDTNLQTNLTEKGLDKNLLRIYSIANSVMEEQGYNALFLAVGFIEWYESEDSEVPLYSPIMLLPVELSRKNVKSPFLLTYTEEPPILNPAMIYKLERDFGIKLNGLADEIENVEPLVIFEKIQKAIAHCKRWKVLNDIYLGLFSFEKFMMFKDLEVNLECLSGHKIIEGICVPGANKEVSIESVCSDDEIEQETAPLNTFQVLDADSSQQRAIVAVKRGSNLVIEGPPGTGKSQTIANIIAECLVAGKKVLFVSQKMAALEVVKSRLEKRGVGEFCLELHSRKSNKRKVIEQLAASMKATKNLDHDHDVELGRLQEAKGELNAYVKALHAPLSSMGITPYKAMSFMSRKEGVKELRFVFKDVFGWSREKYDAVVDAFNVLQNALSAVNNPLTHAWRLSTLTDLSYENKIKIQETGEGLLKLTDELAGEASKLAGGVSFKFSSSLTEVEALLEFVNLLLQQKGARTEILKSDGWNECSDLAQEIISTVDSFQKLSAEVTQKYDIKLIDEDVGALLDHYRNYSKKPLFFVSSSYWKERKVIRKLLRSQKSPSFIELIKDLEQINQCRLVALKIDSLLEQGNKYFGDYWKGRNTDANALKDFSDWMVSFRHFVVRGMVDEAFVSQEQLGRVDKEQVAGQLKAVTALASKFQIALYTFVDLTSSHRWDVTIKKDTFAEIRVILVGMLEGLDVVASWLTYQTALRQCEKLGQADFLQLMMEVGIQHNALTVTFQCQFFRCWIDAALSERPVLKRLDRLSHEKLLASFREMDRKQLELAKLRIRHLLSGNYDASWESSAGSERGILEREARKQRAHKPLRVLFNEVPNLLLKLRPCLMMSPLSVAQFLPPALFHFDVVIFDEASQVPPEDAIGAIMRGSQIVVAGDSKQLPPTTFFQTAVITPEDNEEDFVDYLPDDLDSILDECAVSGFTKTMLEWHYRSRHESLIAFSNKNYYGFRLNTFPNSGDGAASGIKFNYKPSNVYKKGGVNTDEALEVAQRVMQHFRETPELSLGIGTFSIKQKYAIEDALETMRRQDPSLEEHFSLDKAEHFFIKNLESIQGDERDVIFISVGYGKDLAGKLSMNFGPINQIGGERRLNVLVTRAKCRLEVFSSIKGADFDLTKTESSGVHLLKEYLDFAELGEKVLIRDISVGGGAESDSEFEEAVFDELARNGIQCHKQVGCSGYRIDMAVLDAGSPGRYVLGIECDGATYHDSITARDRDRLRQAVLEDLGWRIYRIWSTDWFRNRKHEVERLLQAVNDAREAKFAKKASIHYEFEISYRKNSDKKPVEATDKVHSYVVTTVQRCGATEDFYVARIQRIAEVYAKVVDCESPIHIDVARKRVIEHWDLTSVKSRIEEILTKVEALALREKLFKQKSDFLWSAKDKEVVVRSRDVDGINKSIELIAPEEILASIQLVLKKEHSLPQDELFAQAAYSLGFNKLSEDMKAHIKKIFSKYSKEGMFSEIDGRIKRAVQII